jgi:hypothetical protein
MLATADAAAPKPRQKLDMTFTSTRPGAPTGARLNPTWLGANPGGKPYSITEDSFTFAKGARLDWSVPRVCTASDAQLTRLGPSACPKGSRVGEGEVDLDVGRSVGPIPRIIKTHAVLLNTGPKELVTLARTTNVPTPSPIRFVDRGPIDGLTLSAKNPPIPGFPPPDDFTAVKRDRLKFFKIVKGHGDNRRAFMTTPKACPAGGSWINRASFSYHDGVTQHESSPSPCQG